MSEEYLESPENETIMFKESPDSPEDPRPVKVLDLLDPRMPRCTGQEKADRMLICRDCDRFNGHTCSECGCFMVLKTWLQDATCPLGKW